MLEINSNALFLLNESSSLENIMSSVHILYIPFTHEWIQHIFCQCVISDKEEGGCQDIKHGLKLISFSSPSQCVKAVFLASIDPQWLPKVFLIRSAQKSNSHQTVFQSLLCAMTFGEQITYRSCSIFYLRSFRNRLIIQSIYFRLQQVPC